MKRVFGFFVGAALALLPMTAVSAQEAIRENLPYQDEQCDPIRFRCLTPEQEEALMQHYREQQQQRLEEQQQQDPLTGYTEPVMNYQFRITAENGVASQSCAAIAVNPEEAVASQVATNAAYATRPARRPESETMFQNTNERRESDVAIAVNFLQIGRRVQPVEITGHIQGSNDRCWEAVSVIFARQQSDAIAQREYEEAQELERQRLEQERLEAADKARLELEREQNLIQARQRLEQQLQRIRQTRQGS